MNRDRTLPRGWPGERVSRACVLGCCILIAIGVLRLEASGSYRHSGLPQSGQSSMDEGLEVEKFELGRRLYAGMLRLPESDPAVAPDQGDRLQSLVRRLPASQSKSAERVAQLAGRLTEVQLQALEYFVEERFSSNSTGGRKGL